MADKRIHNLTDEQAAFAEDLHLVTDDETFTAAHKVKMKTIAPKIGHLNFGMGVDEDTYLMRVNNGGGSGGVESKITIANLFALFTDNDDVVDVALYDADSINAATLTLRKFGKLVNGILKVNVNNQPATDRMLYTSTAATEQYQIPEFMRPKYSFWVEVNSEGEFNDRIEVRVDGTIYLATSSSSASNRNFQLSYVTE